MSKVTCWVRVLEKGAALTEAAAAAMCRNDRLGSATSEWQHSDKTLKWTQAPCNVDLGHGLFYYPSPDGLRANSESGVVTQFHEL